MFATTQKGNEDLFNLRNQFLSASRRTGITLSPHDFRRFCPDPARASEDTAKLDQEDDG